VAEPVGAVHRDSHFTGIHALDRSMLELVPEGFACIIRTAYIARVPDRLVRAVRHDGAWLDIGDPAAYLDANLAVLDGSVRLALDPLPRARVTEAGALPGGGVGEGPVWVGVDATVTGRIRRSVVGHGALVPAGAELEDCVVWDGVEVPPGRWRRQVFHDGGVLDVDVAEATRV
jgi:NDP-sugar pyrophosphorylase family protein